MCVSSGAVKWGVWPARKRMADGSCSHRQPPGRHVHQADSPPPVYPYSSIVFPYRHPELDRARLRSSLLCVIYEDKKAQSVLWRCPTAGVWVLESMGACGYGTWRMVRGPRSQVRQVNHLRNCALAKEARSRLTNAEL